MGRTVRSLSLYPLLALLLIAAPAFAQKASDGSMPITTDSEDARAALLTARDHMMNVELSAAREALDAALAADEDFVLALAYRSQLTETGAERDAMNQRVQSGLSSVSEGERVLISAMRKQQKGQMTAAMNQYKKLAKMYPQDADAQFMLGAMYFGMQDSEKSLKQLTRVTELDETYAPAYNLLGYRAMYAGDNTAAETAFRRYIELRPDQANPHDSYAEFLMKQGRFTEAVESYRTAYSLDSRYVSAKARAGVALALSGDGDAARAELREALALTDDPGEKTAIFSDLSNTYLLEDDINGALAALDEGILWVEKKSPDRAAYLTMEKAWVYGVNDRTRESQKMVELIETGLDEGRYSADNEAYIQSRVHFGRAMGAIWAENPDMESAETHIEAFGEYAASTGSATDKHALHELKATKAFASGDMQTAIEHMSQAGDEPHINYFLGRMYMDEGNEDLARAHLQRAAMANERTRSFALYRNRALQAMDGN